MLPCPHLGAQPGLRLDPPRQSPSDSPATCGMQSVYFGKTVEPTHRQIALALVNKCQLSKCLLVADTAQILEALMSSRRLSRRCTQHNCQKCRFAIQANYIHLVPQLNKCCSSSGACTSLSISTTCCASTGPASIARTVKATLTPVCFTPSCTCKIDSWSLFAALCGLECHGAGHL